MNITSKLLIGLLIILGSSFAFEMWNSTTKITKYHQEQAESEAFIIKDMMMAVRNIYHKQFLDSGIELTEKTVGFLPAHAMSRISQKFSEITESGIYFNNVSDRARNPSNKIDVLQAKAVEYFKNNDDETVLKELVNIDGNKTYQYSFPIWIKPYCLECHGSPENTPPTIREKYKAAYGYQVGDLRGVVSIRIPTNELDITIKEKSYSSLMEHIVEFFLIFIFIVFLLKVYVTDRLNQLAMFSNKIQHGNYSNRLKITGVDEVAT